MTSPDPLSPELRRLVDEAGPGAYPAVAREVTGDDVEWAYANPGALAWRTGTPNFYDAAVIVRPRRVTVEVDVDLLERLVDGTVDDFPHDLDDVLAARRLIDEARSEGGQS